MDENRLVETTAATASLCSSDRLGKMICEIQRWEHLHYLCLSPPFFKEKRDRKLPLKSDGTAFWIMVRGKKEKKHQPIFHEDMFLLKTHQNGIGDMVSVSAADQTGSPSLKLLGLAISLDRHPDPLRFVRTAYLRPHLVSTSLCARCKSSYLISVRWCVLKAYLIRIEILNKAALVSHVFKCGPNAF